MHSVRIRFRDVNYLSSRCPKYYNSTHVEAFNLLLRLSFLFDQLKLFFIEINTVAFAIGFQEDDRNQCEDDARDTIEEALKFKRNHLFEVSIINTTWTLISYRANRHTSGSSLWDMVHCSTAASGGCFSMFLEINFFRWPRHCMSL